MNKKYSNCGKPINLPDRYEAKIEDFINYKSPLVVFTHYLNNAIPSHTHNFFELIYIRNGVHKFKVDNTLITLNANDICILNRKAVHSIEYSKIPNNQEIYYLLIHPDYFQDIFFQFAFLNSNSYFYKFLIESQLNDYTHQNYIILRNNEEALFTNLIESLINEFFSENLYKEKMVNLLLSSLMIDISRNYSKFDELNQIQSKDNFHETQAETIIRYIYSKSQTVTLKDLATHFNYNEFYLSSLIKRYTGNTFTTILQSIRFQKICAQLIESDLPIYQIISDNGYTNKSWFTKKFKEYFNKTPLEFRISYKKN